MIRHGNSVPRQDAGQGWLIVAITLLAGWDAWRWYLHRIWNSPEEALTLLPLAGMLVVALRDGAMPDDAIRDDVRDDVKSARRPVVLAAIVLTSYSAAVVAGAPAIVRAGIMVMGLLAVIHQVATGRHAPAALWCLGLLALPLVPTLQFYLGYPMRLVAGRATALLLQLNGLAVTHEGTALVWAGGLVQIDAPCSGVAMLWAGFLLTSALACLHRLDAIRLALALLGGLVLVVACNVLRASSLFYLETGLLTPPPGWTVAGTHAWVGVMAFVGIAGGIVWLAATLSRWHDKARMPSLPRLGQIDSHATRVSS